jgi:hypothetical protein
MTCTNLVHAGPVLLCAVGASLDAAACPAQPTPLSGVNQLDAAIGQGVIQ